MRKNIRWTGKSTNGIWKRTVTAETFIELYHSCIAVGAINLCNGDPYEMAVMEKFGKTWEDFTDEDGDYDDDLFIEWYEGDGSHDLTDKEIWGVIEGENGRAYYQTFEKELENGEFVEITSDDFDENGEYIG